MDRKRKWGWVVATSGAIVLALTASLSGPLRDEAAATHVPINLNGYRFDIPTEYIPFRERPRQKITQAFRVDAERIEITWPSMTPFVDPEDNTPVAVRSRYAVSVLFNGGFKHLTDPEKQRHQFFRSMFDSAIKRGTLEKADDRYGLRRYVDKRFIGKTIDEIEASATLDDQFSRYSDDAYVFPAEDRMETWIECTAESMPDPFSEEAKRRAREKKWVRNPLCRHIFFFPEKNLYVKLSYMREHLPEWQKIQDSVLKLLRSFAVGTEADIRLLRSLQQ